MKKRRRSRASARTHGLLTQYAQLRTEGYRDNPERFATEFVEAPVLSFVLVLNCIITFCIKMFGRCPDMHRSWNARPKTRRVWSPHEEPDGGGARRGACPNHSGLPGRQGDSASGAGVEVSIPTVSKWRQRFSLWGLRGLRDQPRPGKPVRYDTAFRNRVLATLEETPPPGMSHWDGPAVAEKLDASVHAVWRVLRREGIYLQRRRSWCVSTDKEFAPKAADVVGLISEPAVERTGAERGRKTEHTGDRAGLRLCGDRQRQVVRGLKSTYKRHGTLNLFAALEVGTGQVKTKFTEYKKREDFRSFLDGVLADQPPDKEIHVILDNYSPHKRNDDWLAKFEGRVQFHFTPTSASWLNQIEIVFSLLQRKTLNGGSFKTKDQLREAIEAFFRRHNERAKPFRWRKREVKGSQLRNTIVNLRN
jgi:transposase